MRARLGSFALNGVCLQALRQGQPYDTKERKDAKDSASNSAKKGQQAAALAATSAAMTIPGPASAVEEPLPNPPYP